MAQDPLTKEEVPWWDGRSQIPDPNSSCLGLLWELLKLLIPLVFGAVLALKATGGKSSDPNDMGTPKYESLEERQRRLEFDRRLNGR